MNRYIRLVLKNCLRNRRRNLLTMASIGVSLCLLAAVGTAARYGIVQCIRRGSSDTLQSETGSLFPALHGRERQGWIASEWKLTEKKQRAEFHCLTWGEQGTTVARMFALGEQLSDPIIGVLNPARIGSEV
jgi:hypothetical protein